MSNKKEEVADSISDAVRYVENCFWHPENYWTEVFYRNSFNLNNVLKLSITFSE